MDGQIGMNLGSRFASVPHSMEDGAGAMDDVSTREDCREAGHLIGIDLNAAPLISSQRGEVANLRTGLGFKSESGNNPIRFQFQFSASLRTKRVLLPRLGNAQLGADKPQACNLTSVIA